MDSHKPVLSLGSSMFSRTFKVLAAKPAPIRPNPINTLRSARKNRALIIQRDDGMFQIGVGDGALSPFETRSFAEAGMEAPRLLKCEGPPRQRQPPIANSTSAPTQIAPPRRPYKRCRRVA